MMRNSEASGGPRWSWRERTSERILGTSALTSTEFGVIFTFLLLGASWLASYSVGGAGVVAPHWFYVPILFAGVRFGLTGALTTSISAAVLAGPLLPLDTTTGTSQPLSDWTTRGGFFLGLGMLMALFLYERRPVHASRLEMVRIDRALRRALAHQQVEIAYQAIFDIRGRRRRIVGAEALVRWPDAPASCGRPAQLIEVAERTGLIHDLGDYVLRAAAAQAIEWRDLRGPEIFIVGVNISAEQLGAANFVERIRSCLHDTGATGDHLYFEITETAFVSDTDLSEHQLSELHDLGFRIAVDDFGTGYSSLAYVHRFPIDVIKIDQSFIQRLPADTGAASIISTTIQLAHTLGYQAIAEGIETPEQLDMLKTMDCDFAQGFYLGVPGPAEQITAAFHAQQASRARRRTAVEHGSTWE